MKNAAKELIRIARERRHMPCSYEQTPARTGFCARCNTIWSNHERPHDCHRVILGDVEQ